MNQPPRWDGALLAVFGRPRLLLLVMALVAIGVGHRANHVRLDNSPETFFSADVEARERYSAFIETFGADEVLLVELRGASHERGGDLLDLARPTREVEGLEGVVAAISISKIFDTGAELPATLDTVALEDVANEVAALDIWRELGLVKPGVAGLELAGRRLNLALSGFAPVLQFGLLVSLGAFIVLGIDAITLPAMVGEGREADDDPGVAAVVGSSDSS